MNSSLALIAIGISIIILPIIAIADSQKNKYRKTGFYFAVILSFTYQPILLSIKFFGYSGIFIGLIGGIFFTTINFIYILYVENKKSMYFSPILLPIVNVLIHILIVYLIKYFNIYIEGNGYAFGIIFAFLPWLVFILVASILHAKSMRTPNKYGETNNLP